MSRRVFATTQWNVVKQAAEAPDIARTEALNRLLRSYGPAMIEYVKHRFVLSESEAEDMIQQFVADLVLVKNAFARANQSRGKFRTFLMTSIQHFVCDQLRRQKAQKRYPSNGFVSVEETNIADLTSNSSLDQELFDDGFIRQIVAEAIHRTHEYCVARGQSEIWEILYARVLAPHLDDTEPEDYDRLVSELGLRDNTEAQNKLASGKSIFKRCFKSVIEEFSSSAQEFEEEWQYFSRFFDLNTKK